LGRIVAAHFVAKGSRPAKPLVPGAILLEAAEQASLLLFLEDLRRDILPLVRGADKIRWRREVAPDDVVTIRAWVRKKKERSNLFEIQFEIQAASLGGDPGIAADGFIHGFRQSNG